jgi:hypothetical protein
MYNILYPDFPRQISLPQRKTVDRGLFYSMVNKYNGIKRIFASIYNYTGNPAFDNLNLNINKVFFDFDGVNALAEVRKLTACLQNNGFKHIVLFSGAGFHVYLFVDPCDPATNYKNYVMKTQQHFITQLGLNVDEKVIGDIARVATIPNTWNTRRNRFCIPLTNKDLVTDFETISTKAKRQVFDFEIMGDTFFNIRKLGVTIECGNDCNITEIPDDIKREINHDSILKDLPLCISSILFKAQKEKIGWRGRFLTIQYLIDAGHLPGDIKAIFEHYLSQNEFHHCVREEKQVDYVYRRDGNTFPRCESLKKEGFCKCKGFCEKTQEWDETTHFVDIYKR